MTNNAFNLYRGVSSDKELDLREEFYNLLYGSTDEVAKGKVGLIRRMREDDNGELIRCACRSDITDEPDRDSYCRYCNSAGYYWDEYYVVYFKDDNAYKTTEAGQGEYERTNFYFEYNVTLRKTDYIVEVKLDSEGRPVQPVERLKFYNIVKATPFRSDHNRIEFWEVRAKEERKWSVWYGVNLRNRTT